VGAGGVGLAKKTLQRGMGRGGKKKKNTSRKTGGSGNPQGTHITKSGGEGVNSKKWDHRPQKTVAAWGSLTSRHDKGRLLGPTASHEPVRCKGLEQEEEEQGKYSEKGGGKVGRQQHDN